jgi:hypothetical protein
MSMPADGLAAAEELLALARAQTRALYGEEFAAFQALADAREGLTTRLAAWGATRAAQAPAEAAQVRQVLEQVAAIDRENTELVRALLEETARALQRVRQGRAALHGYAAPGQAVARPAALDQHG